MLCQNDADNNIIFQVGVPISDIKSTDLFNNTHTDDYLKLTALVNLIHFLINLIFIGSIILVNAWLLRIPEIICPYKIIHNFVSV